MLLCFIAYVIYEYSIKNITKSTALLKIMFFVSALSKIKLYIEVIPHVRIDLWEIYKTKSDLNTWSLKVRIRLELQPKCWNSVERTD